MINFGIKYMNKQTCKFELWFLYIVNLLLAISDNYYFYHVAIVSHNKKILQGLVITNNESHN